jgi:Uma2 family endonuclease
MLDSPVTTVEQLLELHEPGFSHELVRGELRRMSNAGWWHGLIALRLGARIQNHVEQRGLGGAFAAGTGFLLARGPDTVRCPDVAFVRTERLPERAASGLFVGAPDLAVEVTSPSDTFTAVHEKALDWLAHGAREVWVVEAETRALRVYRPGGAMQFLATTDTLRGGDVLPGFEVPVADLFPPMR